MKQQKQAGGEDAMVRTAVPVPPCGSCAQLQPFAWRTTHLLPCWWTPAVVAAAAAAARAGAAAAAAARAAAAPSPSHRPAAAPPRCPGPAAPPLTTWRARVEGDGGAGGGAGACGASFGAGGCGRGRGTALERAVRGRAQCVWEAGRWNCCSRGGGGFMASCKPPETCCAATAPDQAFPVHLASPRRQPRPARPSRGQPTRSRRCPRPCRRPGLLDHFRGRHGGRGAAPGGRQPARGRSAGGGRPV